MGLTPAFTPSISLAVRAIGRSRLHTCQLLKPISRPTVFIAQPSKPKRATVRMLGPFFPNLGDSKLLKSDIVRNEMEVLERDYGELAKLGHRYEVSKKNKKKTSAQFGETTEVNQVDRKA